MKEPILVTLVVQTQNQVDFSIDFPLKKINSMYLIERERLIRFLIKYHLIQQQDKNKVILEFFDCFNKIYVSEKLITINNNIFQISEKFLGLPNQQTLKVVIYYNFSYSKLIQIDQAIEMFEIEKKQFQEQKIKYQNQFQEYAQQFQEIQNTLEDIQNQLQTQRIQKQQQNVDIVILYSNPIIRINNGMKESLFLDYQSEIDQIQNAILQSNQPIKYQILNASLSNLEYAINLHPLIIHVISHGDYDEKQAAFYLEFQDDGLSIKLKTDEIQNLIQNHKAMTRVQLICISSIVAKKFAEYIPKTISWVIFQKFYNVKDLEGPCFWGEFYEKIFRDFKIQDAFNSAKSKFEDIFWKNENKKICCCFHEHKKQSTQYPSCPYDPESIGFEVSHNQHLKCSQQYWMHSLKFCKEKKKQKDQCKNACLGKIIHKCSQNTQDCKEYCDRIQNIQQKLELNSIDFDNFEQHLDHFGQISVCCCDQFNAILKEEDLIKKFESTHHSSDLKIKFNLSDEKANDLQFCDKIKHNLEQTKEIQYMKIDKQIILVHSSDQQNIDLKQQTLSIISSYFQIYLQQMSSKKQIKNIQLNFNECGNNNWMEYVSNQLEFPYVSPDDFFIQLIKYIGQIKNQDKYLFIFHIDNIINIYESESFKKFYLEIQYENNAYFIIILTVNNIQKDHLKQHTADKLIQLIDLNQIKNLIQIEENQE